MKTADPELTALVGHARLSGGMGGSLQSTAIQQTGDEKQRDHENTETEIGQGKLRQQRNGAFAAVAQITAHANETVKLHIGYGAGVEAVGGQRTLGRTLRTVVGPMTIGAGDFFGILLNGTGEQGVGFA